MPLNTTTQKSVLNLPELLAGRNLEDVQCEEKSDVSRFQLFREAFRCVKLPMRPWVDLAPCKLLVVIMARLGFVASLNLSLNGYYSAWGRLYTLLDSMYLTNDGII